MDPKLTRFKNIGADRLIDSWFQEDEKVVDFAEYLLQPKKSFGRRNSQYSFRKVIQQTMKGEFIKEYESVAEAGRELGIATSNIHKVCKREQKHAHGYYWSYKEDR